MAGIAGISEPGKQTQVNKMVERIYTRGKGHQKAIETPFVTMQAVWSDAERGRKSDFLQKNAVWDGVNLPEDLPEELPGWNEPFALAAAREDGFILARDMLGVKPLYYGKVDDALAFASEVKALLAITNDIHEFPAGSWYTPKKGFQTFSKLEPGIPLREGPMSIADELRKKLDAAIECRVVSDSMGSWLSGGVDSSVIAVLARKYVHEFHSFVSGVSGADDIKYGTEMAEFLGTTHHVITVNLQDMLRVLPEVIYHLESFDALLVRSSVTNYLTGKVVSDYVGAVFSGEAGDELFAGYDYIKQIPEKEITAELQDITLRLHNTALQRVDRSAYAHGVMPMVPFTDTNVVEYAFRIPAKYKVYREGEKATEKWILRKAVDGLVPDSILWRPKAKFWQGAGVREILHDHAANAISDADFARERKLPNGWSLHSKEELMYYRIFREQFGELPSLDWMGRTKGAPVE